MLILLLLLFTLSILIIVITYFRSAFFPGDLSYTARVFYLPTVFFTHFVSARHQPGFSIRGTSTINTQSVCNISKSIIAQITLR